MMDAIYYSARASGSAQCCLSLVSIFRYPAGGVASFGE
ncbi:hypothetical protein VDG1235_4558 [Verrucomicrobiia bacterium DG1235]|nr:hypothetical protein VDG1235_4558 [Verrucomicrobiae bacterium DG1235]